jgi:hypothetical protein
MPPTLACLMRKLRMVGSSSQYPINDCCVVNLSLCRLQVGYLGACLLALLLLPRLAESGAPEASSRIVFVTSDMHYWMKLADIEPHEPQMLQVLGSREYCTKE